MADCDRPTWRVIVVEDDKDSGEAMTALLEEHGLHTTHFPDGESARAHATQHGVDIAILDLELGTTSGVEIARSIRGSNRSGDALLIALSGRVEPAWEVVRHFDAYLRKPVDPSSLADFVEKLARAVLRPSTDG